MHHRVSWLRPTDRDILLTYRESGGMWLKPATHSLNLDLGRHHVAQRSLALREADLLERYEEDIAAYRLTDKGRAFLDDELDVEDLPESIDF